MSEKSETYFYFDLETSGLSPVNDRIMQFAGVRTDLQYMQIGKPINFYVKLPPDILPSPEAVLVTGITPQKTLEEGVSSPEFSRILNEEIAQPRTTYVTYNGITFDIPHVDNTNYRNLHPPYDWRRSGTADILNEIRPQAALRPDGMEWAINEDGLMSFRLEDLTEANEISHELKHDAMGDVMGLIELDKKRYTAQPRLVNYQKRLRDKKNIQEFLQSNPEYIYVDRSIPKEFRHGTVCTTLATLDSSTFITYDLRHDPSDYMSMSETELLEALRPSREKYGSIPVKTFKSNKQPQIFPMVIFSDSAVQERLMLDQTTTELNKSKLNSDRGNFTSRVIRVIEKLNQEKQELYDERDKNAPAESKLYSGFIGRHDEQVSSNFRKAPPNEMLKIASQFQDPRLREMASRYVALYHPDVLTSQERLAFEKHIRDQFFSGGENSKLADIGRRLGALASKENKTLEEDYLIENTRLYIESILPAYEDD